jgi:hypothetical protein
MKAERKLLNVHRALPNCCFLAVWDIYYSHKNVTGSQGLIAERNNRKVLEVVSWYWQARWRKLSQVEYQALKIFLGS